MHQLTELATFDLGVGEPLQRLAIGVHERVRGAVLDLEELLEVGHHRLLEELLVALFGDESHLAKTLEDQIAVLGEDALQDVERAVDEHFAHFADGAEVEHHQARPVTIALARLHEEVPRVRIGVEEAVDEELLVERLDETRGDLDAIEPAPLVLGELGDLEALHEGHGQDVFRRELFDHRRKENVVLAGEVLRHPLHARSLVQVVGLATEQVDERRVNALDVSEGEEALVDLDDDAEHAHVDFDDFADLRVEHLDRDLGAVGEVRDVHLPERRGGDGLVIDRLEALVGALAEAL